MRSRGPDKCACGWSSVGLGKCVFDGDHDECDCPKRSRQKTLVHHDCLELADSERNVDLYHWSSAKFSSTWYDTLSVLVAKGRAQVGVAASSGDWSRGTKIVLWYYVMTLL